MNKNLTKKALLLIIAIVFAYVGARSQVWTKQTITNITSISSVFFVDNNTGWVTGKNGTQPTILKTTDGGTTWTQQTHQTIQCNTTPKVIHFIDANTGWVIGMYTNCSNFNFGGTYVLKTIDGGQTWNKISEKDGLFFTNFQFINATTIYGVGYYGKFYKTTDGGANWTQATLSAQHLYSVFFTDINTGWVGGNNLTFLKTTDGGSTWMSAGATGFTDNSRVKSVFFLTSNVGFVIAGYLYKTTDGGNTWIKQILNLDGRGTSIYFVNSTIGYICGEHGVIFKTIDGGNSWTQQATDVSEEIESLFFINDKFGFGIPTSNGSYDILKYVDNSPTSINLSSNSINENNTIGATIGTLSTTNSFGGGSFTYSFAAGAADNNFFSISGNQLKANVVFDYESRSVYIVKISTIDQFGAFLESYFVVNINDLNELDNNAPTNITLSANSINENNAVGSVIGTLSTTDIDVGNTFTYTLATGGADNSSFTISSNQLKANVVFDYETKSSYNIKIRTTDNGGLFYEKDFTITVTNVIEAGNVAPSNINLSVSSINENNINGAEVGTFTTTDANAGNNFVYTFATGGTDNSSFSISGDKLKANAIFDYETKNNYSIKIRTTDNDNAFYEKIFTIAINNLNEAPTNIALSTSSINENNTVGAVVGTFTTTDDAGNTHTYTLATGGTDNSYFTISGNQLKANAIFDYEVRNNYFIKIRTTDQGGLFYESYFFVTINNVNENSAPTNIALSTNSINENNIIGAEIGTLISIDADAGNTFVYTFATGGTDNSSFSISGDKLKANAVFNYETKNNYSVKIRTTDQGGLFYEKNFTININDVNEISNNAPVNINLSSDFINENNLIGNIIGTFNTIDIDFNNTFTYGFC